MSTLDEIKARAEEARPGPWEVIEDEGTVRTQDGEIMFDRSVESGSYWNSHGRRNAEFIAHTRTDIPKLLAALEAVEGLLKDHALRSRAASDRLNQQVIDREPGRDAEAANRYAAYAATWESAQLMAHNLITEALQ